ncbi:MAG: ABC transporter permease [Chloroflexi bacterium]|nr:ABC transporter permease [Chloroflexota bacterium]MCL5110070.1 ABC transporter permease [Chloroflexota bacterium]
MRGTLAIALRELKSYFASPVAYIVTAAFLVVTGYLFTLILLYSREASLRYLFGNMSVLLLIVSPALTMRLLAEEQRTGTIELLLTSPVRDREVVIGKFLASLGLLAAMLGMTLFYPLLLFVYGHPDKGPILSGYVGTLLLGASFLSIGLFASSLTANQIVAAVLTFMGLLLFWLIGGAADLAGPPLGDLLRYLAVDQNYNDFTAGVVDSKAVVYFISVVVVFMYATVRTLESRRWR